MKSHKHAALIKEWADGAQIQYWRKINVFLQSQQSQEPTWVDIDSPCWAEHNIYRIKPNPVPDLAYNVCIPDNVIFGPIVLLTSRGCKNNLRLIFDGSTGELKKAEVIV